MTSRRAGTEPRPAPRPHGGDRGEGIVLACGGLLLAAALLGVLPAPSAAQTATAVREENLRAEPNGRIVARVERGTPLGVVSSRERWLEVELEGWVWTRSLQVTDRGGMDLVVSAAGGENLRAEPSGDVLARLEPATLLEEVERTPGWIRVRRRAWIWEPSVEVDDAPAQAPAGGSEGGPRDGAAGGGEGEAAAGDAAAVGARFRRSGAGGVAVLGTPDGDTLARTRPGAELEVLARRGSWARVRLEGWVWLPQEGGGSADTAVVRGVTPAAVARDPEGHRGRTVAMELQYISVERAESVRTDFYQGEPFLLTRHRDGGYVYVAVPPDRLEELRGLVPLERIAVVGRVRVGASDLTGSPILDLLELRRVRER